MQVILSQRQRIKCVLNVEVWVILEVIALGTEALYAGNQVVPQEFVLDARKVITAPENLNLR